MSQFLHYWRKENYQLFSKMAMAILIIFTFSYGLYFAAAFSTYQKIAAELASLSSPKGVTDILLLPLNSLILWFLALWCSFFTAKLIASEFEIGTARYFKKEIKTWLAAKFGAILVGGIFLLLPFWIGVLWLSFGTQFSGARLCAIFLSQCIIIGFGFLFATVVSLLIRQALASAVLSILGLLLLWLLPNLTTGNATLYAMTQWFSPFAQANLFANGELALQSGIFIILISSYFLSLIIWIYAKER